MINILEWHFKKQILFPDNDYAQWLAFILLKEKYPKLTYLSYDGYHCHGIADYDVNFNWQNDSIVIWNKDKPWRTQMECVKKLDKDFTDHSTIEIVEIWMDILGETEESKKLWLGIS